MVKKRRRHSAACKLRIALESLEGSKTISRSPNDRAPQRRPPSRPDYGSPPVTAQCPSRHSAAENGLKTNYTTRKCHFHVVFCSLGGNNVSICPHALDRCCIFGSACKGPSARRRPHSCWPNLPVARAGPATVASAARKAAPKAAAVAAPHRAVGPAGS